MTQGAHNGHHGHLSSPRARNGEPQPALTVSEPASAKRDLASWWKQFSKRNMKKEEEKEPERGIFGVPLITSIPYANVAISLFNENGESYIYGYVPIVVAKCGVFLKEKATDVEGIFRLAGSEKRIKELKAQFDTPPRWGKGLDWSGYTVHDAANILRRYFNQLPEPIIPLQYYDRFRTPLRGHQAEAVGQIEGQAPSVGGFDPDAVVRIYQQLIKELPSLNRQLLLYILDLLAVFAAKSDINKMTTSNLAAIFQPGILSHPQHDMSPQDYRLSQDVLIFLIDNQDHFLIGMEGTAVDEGTARHVESGPSTPQARTPTTPGRNQSGLGRSASAASSAAAESVRAFGNIRRNVSTSSRRSRHSGAVPSPTTPSYTSSSGVHRSNTLPLKRSPALAAAHFPRDKGSDPPTPGTNSTEDAKAQLPPSVAEIPSVPESPETVNKSAPPAEEPAHISQRAQTMPVEHTDGAKSPKPAHIDMPKVPMTLTSATPGLEMPGAFIHSPAVAPPTNEMMIPAASVQAAQTLAPPPANQPRSSPQTTPKHEKHEFMEGPVDSGSPAEQSAAVRTFTQILAKVSPDDKDKSGRKPNKLQKRRVPSSNNPSAHSSTHSLGAFNGPHSVFDGPPSPSLPQTQASGAKDPLQAYNIEPMSSRNSGATLKPSMSPSASFRSHSTATEYSEAEDAPKEEKRSFWKSHRRGESKATPTASQTDVHGSIPNADKSMSSIGSSSGRRSLQYDSRQDSDFSVAYGDAKDHERKGPFDWFQKKRDEHKARADKKHRAKSPPGSTHDLSTAHGLTQPRDDLAIRGRSMDMARATESQDSSDVTPTGATPSPLTTPRAQDKVQSMEQAQSQPAAGSDNAEPASPTKPSPPEPTTSINILPATPLADKDPRSSPSADQPEPMRSMLDIGEEAAKSESKPGADEATGKAALEPST